MSTTHELNVALGARAYPIRIGAGLGRLTTVTGELQQGRLSTRAPVDTEDELAGVMGHEIAHADLRHSTRQLTKIMGLSLIAEALLGQEQQQLQQIATNLIALGFSRSHETESDMASVRYLCGTDYDAAGAAGFFRKMEGKPTPPEFLSTHPDPGNRVQKIDAEKVRLACAGPGAKDERMARIKRLLP